MQLDLDTEGDASAACSMWSFRDPSVKVPSQLYLPRAEQPGQLKRCDHISILIKNLEQHCAHQASSTNADHDNGL